MSEFTFVLRPESFCIRRIAPDAPLDLGRLDADWYSLTRNGQELSLVAPEHVDIDDAGDCQRGWSCFTIEGILEFGMVGVLAGVTRILAEANVSIFVVSTYDTDHILVRTEDLESAVSALARAGQRVIRPLAGSSAPARVIVPPQAKA